MEVLHENIYLLWNTFCGIDHMLRVHMPYSIFAEIRVMTGMEKVCTVGKRIPVTRFYFLSCLNTRHL